MSEINPNKENFQGFDNYNEYVSSKQNQQEEHQNMPSKILSIANDLFSGTVDPEKLIASIPLKEQKLVLYVIKKWQEQIIEEAKRANEEWKKEDIAIESQNQIKKGNFKKWLNENYVQCKKEFDSQKL